MPLSGDTAAAQVNVAIGPSDGNSTVTVSASASAIDAAVTPVDDVTQGSNSQTNNSNTQRSNNSSNSSNNNTGESAGTTTGGVMLATAVPVDESRVVVADPVVRPPEGETAGDGDSGAVAGIAGASDGFRKACVGMSIAAAVLAAVVLGVAVGGGGRDPPIIVTDGSTPSDLPDSAGAGGVDVDVDVDVDDDIVDRREAVIALLAPLYEGREGGTGIFDPGSGLPGSEDRVLALEWLLADTIEVPELDENDYEVMEVEVEVDDDDGSNSSSSFSNELLSYDDQVLRVMERYVLALLYFATEGDDWFESCRFLDASDECLWNSGGVAKKGVFCNDRGRPTELSLYWNNLAGTIPHEISLFADDLLALNLGGGSLGGTIPTELAKLTNLGTLAIHDACLEGTVPRELIEIPSLNIVLLHNNQDTLVYGPADEEEGGTGATTALDAKFCGGKLHLEDGIVPMVDCRPDDGLAEAMCGCCICCQPESYWCTDRSAGFSYSSLFRQLSPKTGIMIPFESKCLSEAQRSWIASDCPCIIEGIAYDRDGFYECSNCTVDGAIPSLPPPTRRRRL